MPLTPEYIRYLRLDAAFVREREELMKRMETEQRKQTFKEVENWFKKKYPSYDWQDWAPEPKQEEHSR